ncbi:VIT and VWA domain-containing protein [Tropicimonas sp. TH_r6]|uniref:VIT and vWA domain-containing protein n=1 Tax=Tropicimonas sp. TH_r6 TaxID=3082085 RepID=UPI0029557589|nr:VIT and VWA domain-containing protein [Tropicimonas sp. TH_r6]MDV7141198.1 VIT and VWA domain-containing protein [Tropicimonas sp. TH_r6]
MGHTRFRIFLLLMFVFGAPALAAPEAPAGQVLGEVDGQELALPMLRSDYQIDIAGDLARVTLTQVFENPHGAPMRAEYLFPLNRQAAVHAMEMELGGETIRAQIKRKQEAEADFAVAEQAGKAAALLTQHRPNMFTQTIANLVPGQPVTVRLSYVQPVPRVDGAYELVVPLLVVPRYEGPQGGSTAVTEADGWELKKLPVAQVFGLDLPGEIAPERVGLDLSLRSALPVISLTSLTHPLEITETDGTHEVRFADGRVLDNRDMVIRYVLGGEVPTAGVLAHRDEAGGYLSLSVEPPRAPETMPPTAREIVFVLDSSGSMGGAPMSASKRFMAAALDGLRPHDYFRILSFSTEIDQFATRALPANPANLKAGHRFLGGLETGGGTDIFSAVRTALSVDQPENTLRIVVFLTDGYIGDEASVLREVRGRIGEARIYAFGVGSSVNRYLLEGMAEEGRGYARYVDPTESSAEAAEQFAADLRTPLLTDISVDWGGLDVSEATPARLPDLFDGNSLRLMARFEGALPEEIRVNGRVAGQSASLPVSLREIAEESAEVGAALPLSWARSRIADHERGLAVRDGDATEREVAITRLGLDFGLQSRFTSFVAISESVVNPEGGARPASVPLPQGGGVPVTAYPGFGGASTPEPQALFGLLLLAAFGALRLHRGTRDC